MKAAALLLCGLVVAAANARGAAPEAGLRARELPPLIRPVAGQFTGTTAGKLVVAGGTYWTAAPWASGKKIWTDEIQVLDPGAAAWRIAGRLPQFAAYGAALSTSDSIILVGGQTETGASAATLRLRVVGDRLELTSLPDLPRPAMMLGATVIGDTIYVAGGQDSPTSTIARRDFLALDLSRPDAGWQSLEPLPGAGRILPVVAAQDGAVYVISGAELFPNADGQPDRRYLTDAYRYRPGGGWIRIGDAPRAAVGAPSLARGGSHLFVFGGDDGANFPVIQQLRDAHPGFARDVLGFHTITNTWARAGELPAGLVTTAAVEWQGQIVIPGGEDRPGHRSSQVLGVNVEPQRRAFGFLNYAVLVAYLAVNLLVGVYFARRQKNTNDFFRAGQRISWWAAGIAIFGTQLSSITFMAIPAKTYASDWTYILANAAIVLITPVVVVYYLPFFRRLNVTSAYEYLERRFSLPVRLFGSLAFVLMQTGRMAIVLYLPALALSVVSDLNIYVCILTMGLLSTVYATLGGAEAVTWTEVLQFFVLAGSALLTLALIAASVDGGASALLSTALADGKLKAFDLSADYTTTSLFVVLVGNLFAQLVPYTTDQAVIQRYLTTPTERQAARAIWLNALFVVPATLVFFSIGTALYVFYKQRPELLNTGMQTDAIFPWFIVNQMPAGVSGLVIAGLFAAGQSGTQNSIATAIVTDFYCRFRPAAGEQSALRLARLLTFALGVVGISCAALMATYQIKSLWDVFLTILGLFGGSLAGAFALGIFTRRAHAAGAITGIAASAAILFLVQNYTRVHFFLYAAVGIITCFVVGYLASLIIPARRRNDLEGLTIYTLGERRNSPSETTAGMIAS